MNSAFERAKVIRGAAAIASMLDLIGKPGVTDKAIAVIAVKNEYELQHLLSFALAEIAKTIR